MTERKTIYLDDAMLKVAKVDKNKYANMSDFHDACVDCLKNLPSAQPERKKGEWIPEFDGKFTGGAYWFSCSKCRWIVPEVRNGGWNFCPNCGSYNGGGQNEND